jgi:beta-lactamase regulating signal transducer with metallopeptidase domain/Flp pilus assembly protein TadD
MSALESSLTAFLVKTTLILVAVLAAHFGLRRASAATRHLGLTLAMLSLVLLPFLSLSLPAWQLEVLPQSQAAAPAVGGASPVESEGEAWNGGAAPAATGPESPKSLGVSAASAGGGLQLSRVQWVFVAWAIGVAFVLSRLFAGLLRMRWIVRHGERVTDPNVLRLLEDCGDSLGLRVRPLLVSTEKVGVPVVWGWLRPALIVPRQFTSWSNDRMRAVMIHELGHLKRHDWPVLLLGRVVASLYWFHPLVWCLERCAKRECERACDDLVVIYGTKPSDYATHLLSIARNVSESPASVRAALAVVRRSNLNGRLRSILDPLLRRNAPSRTAITSLGTTLLLALVPLASLQFAERAYADEPRPESEILLAQQSKVKHRELMHEEESSEGKRAYEQGYKLHSMGRYDEAAEAFEQALDLEYRPGTSMYNVACCHALMGDADRAIDWLEKAMAAGFDDPENLVNDSDFDPIRSDRTFQDFIDRAFESAEMERLDPEHYPYRSTLRLFDELKQTRSTDGGKWHKVGYKLISLRDLDRAVEAFGQAVEHMGEGKKSTAMYNLACANSLAGRTRAALDWLERSVDAGFDQHERFINDPDLNNIRNEAEFDRIADKSEFLSLGRFPRREWDKSDYSEERWAPAVEEYREYVGSNPSSGRAWFNLGWALHLSSRHDEAAGAFEKAIALDFRPSVATYNIACGNAMLNRREAALDALESVVESGMIDYGQVKGDEDLDNLRDEPRFQALLERLEEQQRKHREEMEFKKQKQKMKLKRVHEHADTDDD